MTRIHVFYGTQGALLFRKGNRRNTQYRKLEDRSTEEQEQIIRKIKVEKQPRLEVRSDKAAYTVQEAMVLMDLNRREVMEMIHSGELCAKIYGGKYLI